jgi:hypothetical protein
MQTVQARTAVTDREGVIMSDVQREELAADGMMSVDELMGFLGLRKTEVFELLASGAIASVKHGKRRLVFRRSAVRWLAAKLAPVGA